VFFSKLLVQSSLLDMLDMLLSIVASSSEDEIWSVEIELVGVLPSNDMDWPVDDGDWPVDGGNLTWWGWGFTQWEWWLSCWW
jgi:hypothetical protein